MNTFFRRAAAATVFLAWANGAQASQYTMRGTVTSAQNNDGIDVTSIVGKPLTIAFDIDPSLSLPGASSTQTDMIIALISATVTIGSISGTYSNNYPEASDLQNDGATSSLSFNFGTAFSQIGPYEGEDGGVSLTASSAGPEIPLDPDQSFGPIVVTGSGSLTAAAYSFPSQDGKIGGYTIDFDVSALQASSSTAPVPLPPSALLLGGALLAIGAASHTRRRIKAAASA